MSKVLIIDNFLKDPDKARAEALLMDFITKGSYPGRDTVGLNITPEILTTSSRTLGKTLIPAHPTANFRISLAGDTASRHIHFDNVSWVCTVYLTPNEFAKGGTAIWVNRSTGMNVIHSNNTTEMNDIVRKEGLDESLWDLDMVIPMRYNRAVFIDGKYWHSVAPGFQGFGDRPENGRLTQHFFFNEL